MFRRSIHRSANLNKLSLEKNVDSKKVGSVKKSRKKKVDLEKVVFGRGDEFIDSIQNVTGKRKLKTNDESDDESPNTESIDLYKRKRIAAWKDIEDEKITVRDVLSGDKIEKNKSNGTIKKYLENKFTDINGTPAWAKLVDKNSDDVESTSSIVDDILRNADDYFEDETEFLNKNVIDIKRVRDLNHSSGYSDSILNCVEFHPTAAVALTAGNEGVATLYQVDGHKNPKIHSVKFNKFQIKSAHFSSNGEQFIVASKLFGYFYYYDMMGGKVVEVPWRRALGDTKLGHFTVSPDNQLIAFCALHGEIQLFTARTKDWIGTLKMNNNVRAIAFNNDGSKMYTHGDDGEVYIWDMNSRECIHKFCDDGCVKGTALSVSNDGKYLSCGSDSGVVNVYEDSSLSSTTPQPIKILLNLTTTVTKTKFNCNSEIMGMVSALKNNAVKLVHFPSMTVFSNFPVMNAQIRRPLNFDFSLNSGYLTISNNTGKAFLYRLRHYKNY